MKFLTFRTILKRYSHNSAIKFDFPAAVYFLNFIVYFFDFPQNSPDSL